MRRSLQLTGESQVRNIEAQRQINITCSITRTSENRALQWYGNAHRTDETRWPQKILDWQPVGERKRGAPALTWQRYINRAVDEIELTDEDWNNKGLWRENKGNSRQG